MSSEKKKLDLQTISLFLTLAVLTGVVVLGLRWILLAPESSHPQAPTEVEKATK